MLRGVIPARRAEEALEDHADLRIRRYAHWRLMPRIWDLRANVTAFDGAYVALAEALAVPLVTTDEALAHAPGHTAVVEVIR